MVGIFLSCITAVQIKETQLGKLTLRSRKITGIGKGSLRGKRLTGCIAKPACFKLKLSNPVYSKDEESTMRQIRRQQSYCITAAWTPCGEFHTLALFFKLLTSQKKFPSKPKMNRGQPRLTSVSLWVISLQKDTGQSRDSCEKEKVVGREGCQCNHLCNCKFCCRIQRTADPPQESHHSPKSKGNSCHFP